MLIKTLEPCIHFTVVTLTDTGCHECGEKGRLSMPWRAAILYDGYSHRVGRTPCH